MNARASKTGYLCHYLKFKFCCRGVIFLQKSFKNEEKKKMFNSSAGHYLSPGVGRGFGGLNGGFLGASLNFYKNKRGISRN